MRITTLLDRTFIRCKTNLRKMAATTTAATPTHNQWRHTQEIIKDTSSETQIIIDNLLTYSLSLSSTSLRHIQVTSTHLKTYKMTQPSFGNKDTFILTSSLTNTLLLRFTLHRKRRGAVSFHERRQKLLLCIIANDVLFFDIRRKKTITNHNLKIKRPSKTCKLT